MLASFFKKKSQTIYWASSLKFFQLFLFVSKDLYLPLLLRKQPWTLCPVVSSSMMPRTLPLLLLWWKIARFLFARAEAGEDDMIVMVIWGLGGTDLNKWIFMAPSKCFPSGNWKTELPQRYFVHAEMKLELGIKSHWLHWTWCKNLSIPVPGRLH